ncbi:hypothetical protein [Paraburkholderia strydomiana]|uniref:hypothetical protein n=1 Tax=Paraburkholderia strydomiana TaxID=1245417 RepID=UPI0010390FA3
MEPANRTKAAIYVRPVTQASPELRDHDHGFPLRKSIAVKAGRRIRRPIIAPLVHAAGANEDWQAALLKEKVKLSINQRFAFRCLLFCFHLYCHGSGTKNARRRVRDGASSRAYRNRACENALAARECVLIKRSTALYRGRLTNCIWELKTLIEVVSHAAFAEGSRP